MIKFKRLLMVKRENTKVLVLMWKSFRWKSSKIYRKKKIDKPIVVA